MKKIKKRILSLLLCMAMVFTSMPVYAEEHEEITVSASETEESGTPVIETGEDVPATGTEEVEEADVPEETQVTVAEQEKPEGTSLDTSDLTFDISSAEADGYVTISFKDNGDRSKATNILDESLYGKALGTIIKETKVPFESGDNIADVTVRLLKAMGLKYDSTGSVEDGFYLAAIKDFELNDVYYPSLGEFDVGARSGWCVRLNDWHINQGASAFDVVDGDSIEWLYTCQNGTDIGADFSSKSAQITGISFADEYGVLSPEFAADVTEYTYALKEEISSIAFKLTLENYASVVTLKVEGKEVVYRPNQKVSVNSNSVIEISTKLEYMDAANNNKVTTYTDSMRITLVAPVKENQAPEVTENVSATMAVAAGEKISVNLNQFFTDPDGDELTYTVKIDKLGINQTIEGSEFTGTIPAAGEYEAVITASDGKLSVSHTVKITVSENTNTAPNIKAEYAETRSQTYVYGNSYVYIYMDDIFEDADGDTLSYEATLDGEKVDIAYNSWRKEYYIQFAAKPVVREYKIKAYDGMAYSEEFTAKCIGTSATIKAQETSPLMEGGNYFYYVMGSAYNDTFKLDYSLDVNEKLDAEWVSSNANVLSSNGDGTFTVSDSVTSRQQIYVGVTCGKDNWGSPVYLGTKYIYILPAMPEVADIEAPMAEHADQQKAVVVSNAFTGWYSSEFDYELSDPSIASFTTSGYYGFSITPKALGTTTVTATFKYDKSIQCSFDITVTGRSLQMKDQPGEDSVVYETGKTVQMEVLGAQEGDTYTWTSSDESVATVDKNGLVTVKKLGVTYIKIEGLSGTSSVSAGMYLQVKEAGKVYLEDISLTQYSYFMKESEGTDAMISAKSAFNSAQLEYDWKMFENRYSYGNLQFTPYFDGENLDAVLYYQVSGGEYQTMELTDEKAVGVTNGLAAGENVVKIEVSPKDDKENVTTYTFNIFRPYNPTNTISHMTVYPNAETALTYPKYMTYAEGTIFYNLDAETKEPLKSTWGYYSTGWNSSQSEFKTYVFGDRTKEITLYPTFGYAGERVMIYVNGEAVEEAVTTWETKSIPVPEKGKITEITFHVNSEKYHVQQLADGVEDPYGNPEKVYTLYVENVTPLGINSKILSAELETGEFYKPGFSSDKYNISALVANGQTSEKMTFTVADGIEVYKSSISAANKLVPTGQDEDGSNVYSVELSAKNYSYTYATTNIILQTTDKETGETGQTQYAFTVNQRGTKDIYPDSVEEYLCIGSQYTNAGSYGTMPERTLENGGDTLSLGNFGGYIIYKYNTPIENSANNPYGVDFIVYGNSFGNGGHEPGYVQVSKDGKTWYTLAGSEHYDDHNDWGFTMTYINVNGKSAWKSSDGESGQIYSYPSASSYPYFTWTEDLEQSITVSGPRLNSSAKDAYGSSAAVLPVFGYVDVNTNGAINGTSNNPYNHPGTLVDGGDQFDISWAVDEKGMPVELDSISYIRVATASSIYAGAIGEKSTEVSTVNRVTNAAETAVGKTEAPSSITVNGTTISKTDEDNVYEAVYKTGELTVNVEASEGTNVYINNAYGTSRTYEKAPEKGILRVIVQEGEKEPYIAYIKLVDEIQEPEEPQDTEVDSKVKEIYETTRSYLTKQAENTVPTVSSVGGDWLVLGLERSGVTVSKDYYNNVVKHVLEEINSKEQLHKAKSTENSRVILALTAAGYDVTDVAGHNLLKGLTDMNYVKYQGVNGPIWALIAFDSHDYEIPAGGNVTREALIDEILDAQLADGGWALEGTTADSDMTGMAIQALAPYYESDADVKEAVDQALARLSAMQRKDGGFVTVGEPTCESNAQVLAALTALGIDPTEEARFIKDGNTVIDALCGYYVKNGGFAHLAESSRDGMATEQAFYALVSYFRMISGETALYDMNDVKIKTDVEYEVNGGGDKKDEDTAGNSSKEEKNKDTDKITAEGKTKVIGDGENKVVIDGVIYMVDKEAAVLMQTIDKLSKQDKPDGQMIIDAYKEYIAMSKGLKAQIFNFDDLEKMTDELGSKNHKDEVTGMEVTGLDWYIRLDVEEVNAGDEYSQLSENTGNNELVKAWKIQFLNLLTEEMISSGNAVTLKVKAPEMGEYAEMIVVHQKEDGQYEYLECKLEEGYLIWQTESAGLFGLAGNMGESVMTLSDADAGIAEEVKDSVPAIWPWIVLASAGAALLIIVVIKKKRQKNEEA